MIDFVVARYGDYVLLTPPVEPATYTLWFGPPLLLTAGELLIFSAAAAAAAVDAAAALRRDHAPGSSPQRARGAAFAGSGGGFGHAAGRAWARCFGGRRLAVHQPQAGDPRSPSCRTRAPAEAADLDTLRTQYVELARDVALAAAAAPPGVFRQTARSPAIRAAIATPPPGALGRVAIGRTASLAAVIASRVWRADRGVGAQRHVGGAGRAQGVGQRRDSAGELASRRQRPRSGPDDRGAWSLCTRRARSRPEPTRRSAPDRAWRHMVLAAFRHGRRWPLPAPLIGVNNMMSGWPPGRLPGRAAGPRRRLARGQSASPRFPQPRAFTRRVPLRAHAPAKTRRSASGWPGGQGVGGRVAGRRRGRPRDAVQHEARPLGAPVQGPVTAVGSLNRAAVAICGGDDRPGSTVWPPKVRPSAGDARRESRRRPAPRTRADISKSAIREAERGKDRAIAAAQDIVAAIAPEHRAGLRACAPREPT